MPSLPDPLDLQCVVILAETLSFTETAKRLHMTQPGVTARINRVEANHGYKLFDRNKGVVRAITPEGFVFVEEARRVLDDLLRLTTQADAAHRAFSETISISRSHHADLQLLSILVSAQAIENARISFLPPCKSDEEAIAMLLNGDADIALVAWPVNEPHVTALHLTHDTLLAVLPENHALRERKEIHIADLRNEQLIGSKYQYPTVLKETFRQRAQAIGFTPQWVCISASTAESVHLVDAGARPGITLVTRQYAKELALGRAVCIPFDEAEIAYEYGVAYRQSDNRPILNTLLQYLVEKCRPVQNPRRKRGPDRITHPAHRARQFG